ncbi:MAG TPA: hypothetical protein VJ875_20815 [Pyrinomonadaceae bacterium]|nr:hypothetical protein [Pyrinomonadaceae bacterium]
MALNTISRGWLPVDAVVVEGRPGLWWMDMSGVSLAEPFFQQTVDRAKAENNRGELFTEFDVLLQLEKLLDSVSPTGFIFHSSRCGSTLLANACRAIDGSIVLSEANGIDKLVARFVTDAPEGSVKESLYSVFLRGVVHALGQRRIGNERHLFVKFAACSFAQIHRIRRIWPHVPCVFLYRDPIETIVSNLVEVPPWLIDKDRRILASIIGATPAAVAGMQLEELCARTIGGLYSLAQRVANDKCLLLNYNQLSLPIISNVLSFFNVNPSAEEMKSIERMIGLYSKEVSATRPFVADSESKEQTASKLVREMAAKWASEAYRQLEQKRLERS